MRVEKNPTPLTPPTPPTPDHQGDGQKADDKREEEMDGTDYLPQHSQILEYGGCHW